MRPKLEDLPYQWDVVRRQIDQLEADGMEVHYVRLVRTGFLWWGKWVWDVAYSDPRKGLGGFGALFAQQVQPENPQLPCDHCRSLP